MTEKVAHQLEKEIQKEAVRVLVDFIITKKYLSQIRDELGRFLLEYYKKQRDLDMISEIVGMPVGGEVGHFKIKEMTEGLVEDIATALVDGLSPEDTKQLKENIKNHVKKQANENRNNTRRNNNT